MTRSAPPLPTVLRDTREQDPLSPYLYRVRNGVAEKLRLPTRDVSLETADYSLPGLEKMVAIERKSLPDLWGTCFGRGPLTSCGEVTRSIERFRREMSRLQWLARKAILVEGSKATLMAYARERYLQNGCKGRSPEENVNSLLSMLSAIWVDYGVPVAWEGSREGAEAWLGRVLARVWDQHCGGEKARVVRLRGQTVEDLPWLAAEAPAAKVAPQGGYPHPREWGRLGDARRRA